MEADATPRLAGEHRILDPKTQIGVELTADIDFIFLEGEGGVGLDDIATTIN